MKNNILDQIFLCFLLPFFGVAQPPEPPVLPPFKEPSPPNFHKEYNGIQPFPEKEAEFPGGIKALMSYLNNNLVIPLSVLEDDLQGKVWVKFVIEKDGSISKVEILRGLSKDCDREVIGLIKTMPKWKPGYSSTYYNEHTTITENLRDTVPVRSSFTLPIAFKNSNYPILPQGYDTLKNYLTTNLVYPKRALKEKIEGKVYVKLLFAETGEVKDVVLLKGMENCPECDKEAIRLMKSVPKEIMTANDEKYSPKPFFFNTYIDFKPE